MRPTPFAHVFGEIAPLRFPAIAKALDQGGGNLSDRDRFTLLEPVGRLLRDIVPEAAGADVLEAHVLLLHHAFAHWAAGGAVYQIGEAALRRALTEERFTSDLPGRPALYVQLPELRVWGTPTPDGPAEPLDGIFVSATPSAGSVAVLAIFGMRPDRPGFSAVGLEGRADTSDATRGEIEVAAARADGSAPFGPTLAGGTAAGLYSVANPGELLLLTCRLLAHLPTDDQRSDSVEHVVPVE